MKTWEDVKSVDDLVTESEKEIIKEIEIKLENRCPYLKRLKNYFYYCSGGVPEDAELEFEPSNPFISAKTDVIQLQLHCMESYKSCCSYKGILPFPGSVVVRRAGKRKKWQKL